MEVITKDGDEFEVIKVLKDRYQIKPKNISPIVIDGVVVFEPKNCNYYVSKKYVNEVKGMKYIRTKNGIYELKTKMMLNHIKEYRQADTIAELCDEFVLYDNQLKTYGVFDKKVITFKWLQNHLDIYKGMTIYGAIWTDKGLIYVAKMNEKGDLELI